MIARSAAILFLAATTATAQTPDPAPAPAAGPAAPATPRPKPIGGNAEVSRNAPVNGVLVLYGNERCPTNKDGAEVVVCVRRGAEEQFRIPKELREFQVTPQNESWAAREKDVLGEGVGVSSIGSCSAVGPGGSTGCVMQQARQTRRENAAKAKEANPDLSPY